MCAVAIMLLQRAGGFSITLQTSSSYETTATSNAIFSFRPVVRVAEAEVDLLLQVPLQIYLYFFFLPEQLTTIYS